MRKAIIGKKVGMTQIFDESGKVIPVTVIEAGPCTVTQKKSEEKDGYVSVQLGFEEVKESKLSKPEMGHLKKAGVAAMKHLKEFKLDDAANMSMSPVFPRATATRALSSVTAQAGPRPPTAAAPSTVMQAPWAPAPIPPVSSRARSALARWAWSRSPSRIWMLSKSTPN